MAADASPSAAARARGRGLLASLRHLGQTIVTVLHTRAELLSLELARERTRITRLFVLALAALFFLGLGALTLTLFIIVLFWERPLVVIGVLTVVYLGIGIAVALAAKREARASTHPFAASLAELKKDRDRFLS